MDTDEHRWAGSLARERMIRRRLRAVGFAVLYTGLFAAILLFLYPRPVRERQPIGFENMGGRSVPIYKESSKRYQQAARSFLGPGGMLLSDIREGFVDLWYGRKLAYTIAVLAVIVSYGIFYFSEFFGFLPGDPAKQNTPEPPPAKAGQG